jgi:acetyl esterase/lipase
MAHGATPLTRFFRGLYKACGVRARGAAAARGLTFRGARAELPDGLLAGFFAGGCMPFWPKSPDGKSLREIEPLRRRYDAHLSRLGKDADKIAFEPGQLGPIKGEWLRAPDGAQARILLYFHGGGYIAGTPRTHRALLEKLAQAGEAGAFSVAYRLAPECNFPAPVRDGVDAYRALLGRGAPAHTIILAGDEAGGGLAFAVMLAIRNAGLAMPAGLVALSPWADLTLSGWSMLENRQSDKRLDRDMLFSCARHYLKNANPADPYASPVFADFKNFPPVMVHAGAAEILRGDASRLGACAAEAGIAISVEIYDGMGHLFQADARAAQARASLGRLGHFIRSRTK